MELKDFRMARVGEAVIYQGDCLDIMPLLPRGEARLVVTDPPYGCTGCAWDKRVDLERYWREVLPLCLDNAAHCVFCQMPFAAELYASNRKMFRHDLVYAKAHPTGYLNAKRCPLRAHELIFVFARHRPWYQPQLNVGEPYATRGRSRGGECYKCKTRVAFRNPGFRYPTSIVRTRSDGDPAVRGCGSGGTRHSTQKNLHALAFLIRSYSLVGEMVLDPFMGTGSTGVAALRAGRRFVGIEREERFFEAAVRRLEEAARLGPDLILDPEGYEAKMRLEGKLPEAGEPVLSGSAGVHELLPGIA